MLLKGSQSRSLRSPWEVLILLDIWCCALPFPDLPSWVPLCSGLPLPCWLLPEPPHPPDLSTLGVPRSGQTTARGPNTVHHPIFINKVFTRTSHAHWVMYYLNYWQSWVTATETIWPMKLIIFFYLALTDEYADLWPKFSFNHSFGLPYLTLKWTLYHRNYQIHTSREFYDTKCHVNAGSSFYHPASRLHSRFAYPDN